MCKLYFTDGADPSIDLDHWRPGLIVAEPHTPLAAKGYNSGSPVGLHKYGRLILIPGNTGVPWKVHGEIVLEYRNKDLGWQQRKGSYQFWSCVGISDTVGDELVAFVADFRAYSTVFGAHPGEDIQTTSTRLFAEIIDIITPSDSWEQPKHDVDVPAPGEIVTASLFKDGQFVDTPFLVLSSVGFNSQPSDVLVALQCIEYVTGDENESLLLPIAENGCHSDLNGLWSIAIPLVQGITRASKTIRRFSSPLHLEPSAFRRLKKRLEYFYG